MTKKIFRSVFTASLAVFFICFSLVLGILFQYFTGVQKKQLQSELNIVATAVELCGIKYLKQLTVDNYRVTLIAADGKVLFDSHKDVRTMENHKDREEIKEALETGVGESLRYSSTLTEKTFYVAKRLSNGCILRVSSGFVTVLFLVLGMLQPILIVFIFAFGISFYFSRHLSKKIVEPFNSIDLENPLENNVYDELSFLLSRLDKQQKKIAVQKNELFKKQTEFCTIVENMNEGLILLNINGTILSMNRTAHTFLGTENAVGKTLSEIERSTQIEKAIRSALKLGNQSLEFSKNNREYQLNISLIQSNKEPLGIVILIFDITEKMFAERSRKEFTANVSHELKTPLHSIIGSAELLKSGLVQPEDVSRFVGHIHTEASRLVYLIEDIIRLSQLDESVFFESESVNLFDLAKQEILSLQQVANRKNVTLSLIGESAEICGIRQLFHEIIYNLCDNAIKYNVSGGKVEVTVSNCSEQAILTVSDSGIGILPEHLDRIFERFYRVDKSHSKQTGGTGLGLSIVKHAVQYMNGKISVDSIPQKGTTVTVVFPKLPVNLSDNNIN